jgi:anti-sigma regulatory factor (Ser/Thr protein kinase)
MESMSVPTDRDAGFRHEALFYADDDEFLAGTLPFIRDGLTAGEPVLVAVGRAKTRLLRSDLGEDAERIAFADIRELGRNPACIIPLWSDFVADRPPGARVRGIGEPVWPERTAAELVECRHHESLLNLAFADAPGWWLLCPYDSARLNPSILDGALRTHPLVAVDGLACETGAYVPPDAAANPFSGAHPPAPEGARVMDFDGSRLADLRQFVAAEASAAGLESVRASDLVVAVNEVATNSVRYGGGGGRARVWLESNEIVCEVSDRGWIVEPLAGRRKPRGDLRRGWGLWLVNQVCDLVQIRSSEGGTAIRMRMATDLASPVAAA